MKRRVAVLFGSTSAYLIFLSIVGFSAAKVDLLVQLWLMIAVLFSGGFAVYCVESFIGKRGIGGAVEAIFFLYLATMFAGALAGTLMLPILGTIVGWSVGFYLPFLIFDFILKSDLFFSIEDSPSLIGWPGWLWWFSALSLHFILRRLSLKDRAKEKHETH